MPEMKPSLMLDGRGCWSMHINAGVQCRLPVRMRVSLQVVQVQHRGQSPKLQGCLLVLTTFNLHEDGPEFLLFAKPNFPSRYLACGD